MPDEDLRKAFEELDRVPLKIGPGGKGIARLVNEDDPQGPVEICDSKGNPYMVMPRDVYDQIMRSKPSV